MKKFIIKGLFVTVFAFSTVLTGVTTYVGAEGSTNTSVEVNETVNLQSNPDVHVEAEETVIAEENLKLLPGDLFYFVKIILENLQLMLTFDDIEKASLYADIAAKRIAEAELLLLEGDEELALSVLKEAAITIESTNELVIDGETSVDMDSSDSSVGIVVEEDSETTVVTEEPKEEVANQKDTVEFEEKTTANGELEAKHAQNIISLTLAMEKITNSNAKAALARNIEHSLMKLETKLAKSKAKIERKAENELVIETEANTNIEIEKETDAKSKLNVGTEINSELQTVALQDDENEETAPNSDLIVDTKQAVAPIIDTKEQVKTLIHDTKVQAKEDKKLNLELAKEIRVEAKGKFEGK